MIELYNQKKPVSHYHGNVVRILFLVVALIIVLSLPIFQSLLNVPIMTSVLLSLALGIAAGLTNPLKEWSALINVIISAAGFVIYEYIAVILYQADFADFKTGAFFFTNLIIGLLFLISLYFAVRTLRNELIKN